ncbi:PP2C family protein-serine/threonine phosphatase [Streptomyces sp. NPDC020917]|uniref:PP2C family protein-serine/threonine phosphatase n=1 Tax=Streptomyces sp. NPDC020917 TaxID=3365102 RepID=UPI0037BB85D8
MRSQPGGGHRSWQDNRGLVWIPLVLIVAIALADIFSPQDIHLGPLLVVAPALTASFGGSRLTAAIGALAVAALLVIAAVRATLGTANFESQLASLLLISVITVVFARLRERHDAELRQVRSVAEAAQQAMLHPLPERIGTLHVASAYQAAADQARIGGDLYAAVRARGGSRLLIGDVRGKGLAAVDDAALLLGAFRSCAHRELSLPELQRELQAIVDWGLDQPAREGGPEDEDTLAGESFITCALIDVPDDTPVVHILNSGHPAPLRLRAGQVEAFTPTEPAPPMGVNLALCRGEQDAGHAGKAAHAEGAANDEPIANAEHAAGAVNADDPPVDTFSFAAGDILLLYTDGATDARDPQGRFYPLAERLGTFGGCRTPGELLERIRADLLDHSHGSLGDDAALVAVMRAAAGA